MPKRQPKPESDVSSRVLPEIVAELRRALGSRKKSELVDILMEIAERDRSLFRQLTDRFDVAPAPDQLVAATRQAIIDATAFDKRQIGRNFAYDHAAYGEVKRNMGRLINSGQLREAMSLALELMKRGSYQVEMSDEGMMTDDIEDSLKELLEALKHSDLPAAEVIAWSASMLNNDRVGAIAFIPLRSLRDHLGPIEPS